MDTKDRSDVEIESAGGVRLQVPDDWSELVTHEHLAALAGPHREGRQMAPVCLVNDQPGHLDSIDWWASMQAAADGPLLLEVAEHDDGFEATFAHTTEQLSSTGHTRIYHLPGRSLVVSVSFDSAETDRMLALAHQITRSVAVEGLP